MHKHTLCVHPTHNCTIPHSCTILLTARKWITHPEVTFTLWEFCTGGFQHGGPDGWWTEVDATSRRRRCDGFWLKPQLAKLYFSHPVTDSVVSVVYWPYQRAWTISTTSNIQLDTIFQTFSASICRQTWCMSAVQPSLQHTSLRWACRFPD